MTTLTITSLNQGFRYDEASSSAMLAVAIGMADKLRTLMKSAGQLVAARPVHAGHLARA